MFTLKSSENERKRRFFRQIRNEQEADSERLP